MYAMELRCIKMHYNVERSVKFLLALHIHFIIILNNNILIKYFIITKVYPFKNI